MEIAGIMVAMLSGMYIMKNSNYIKGEVVYIKSNIDNNKYLVRDLPDKQMSADLLARVSNAMEKLVIYLKENKGKYKNNTKCIDLLIRRFNPRNITEGGLREDYTTYTINKGDEISFCLRTRDTSNNLHDLNLLIFVAIHELAHIGSIQNDPGHKTNEFKQNFEFLTRVAVDNGIWNYTDYSSNPVMYCGTVVNSVPIV